MTQAVAANTGGRSIVPTGNSHENSTVSRRRFVGGLATSALAAVPVAALASGRMIEGTETMNAHTTIAADHTAWNDLVARYRNARLVVDQAIDATFEANEASFAIRGTCPKASFTYVSQGWVIEPGERTIELDASNCASKYLDDALVRQPAYQTFRERAEAWKSSAEVVAAEAAEEAAQELVDRAHDRENEAWHALVEFPAVNLAMVVEKIALLRDLADDSAEHLAELLQAVSRDVEAFAMAGACQL